MDEQPADRRRHLFAERVVDVENGDLDPGGGERFGGRAAETRSPAGDNGGGGGIDLHGGGSSGGNLVEGDALVGAVILRQAEDAFGDGVEQRFVRSEIGRAHV